MNLVIKNIMSLEMKLTSLIEIFNSLQITPKNQ